mmetsp:Transcript_27409/g.59899  ORF Transcript_27409/g.59899 Transcript_27409/m.59899 type:complete len:228 (+) Transcript_27409:209-892(+)
MLTSAEPPLRLRSGAARLALAGLPGLSAAPTGGLAASAACPPAVPGSNVAVRRSRLQAGCGLSLPWSSTLASASMARSKARADGALKAASVLGWPRCRSTTRPLPLATPWPPRRRPWEWRPGPSASTTANSRAGRLRGASSRPPDSPNSLSADHATALLTEKDVQEPALLRLEVLKPGLYTVQAGLRRKGHEPAVMPLEMLEPSQNGVQASLRGAPVRDHAPSIGFR